MTRIAAQVGSLPALSEGALLLGRDSGGTARRAFVFGGKDGASWAALDSPPIGTTYVQFPGYSDPGTLYPGTTWSNISSSFAGAFFRAEGGNASAFGGGAQAYMHDSHSHGGASGGMSTSNPHHHTVRAGNTSYDLNQVNNFMGGSSNTNTAKDGVMNDTNIDHSHFINADGGVETRPLNYTIRIWARTA